VIALCADCRRERDVAAVRHEATIAFQVDDQCIQFRRLDQLERGRAQPLVADAVHRQVQRACPEGRQPDFCVRPAQRCHRHVRAKVPGRTRVHRGALGCLDRKSPL
jgi:hypothetical protein